MCIEYERPLGGCQTLRFPKPILNTRNHLCPVMLTPVVNPPTEKVDDIDFVLLLTWIVFHFGCLRFEHRRRPP